MDKSMNIDGALDILLGGAQLTVHRAGLFSYQRWYDFPYRVFPDYDLILIGKGSGVWEIEGLGSCRIGPGSVLLIPPHVRNGTSGRVEGKCSLVGIHFDLRIANGADFFQTVPFKLVMKLGRRKELFAQACRIATEWSDASRPGRSIIVHDLTRALLVDLVRLYTQDGLQTIATDGRVLEVLRRLEDEYAGELSVGRMSRWVGVSVSHLRALFKSSLGLGPAKALQARRIREARRLLLGTSRPVNSVARAVGFSDPLYFSRVFRRTVGISPLDFRRSAKSP